jgi:hypothetical protein
MIWGTKPKTRHIRLNQYSAALAGSVYFGRKMPSTFLQLMTLCELRLRLV